MHHRVIVLILAIAAVGSARLSAGGRRPALQVAVEQETAVPRSEQALPTTLSVRGRIDRYDPSTRTLSLSTAGGIVRLPVSPATRIRRGRRIVDATELGRLAGDRATVRYTDSDGRKVVESVHVFGQ